MTNSALRHIVSLESMPSVSGRRCPAFPLLSAILALAIFALAICLSGSRALAQTPAQQSTPAPASAPDQREEKEPPAQAEDYKIYTEPPRLFLRAQRQRLIRRERERDSLRWRQFASLMSGKARMPEPGAASALYFRATTNPADAKPAIDWATSAAATATTDTRQLALVYDWCQEVLTPPQKSSLQAKLRQAMATKGTTVADVHARVLAAVAMAEAAPEASEAVIRAAVLDWWRGRIALDLKAGKTPIKREEMHLLFEMLHAIRDNTNIDLREDARKWFKDAPARQLLSYYPAPVVAPENEFRVPVFSGKGDVDLKAAALSRAAELMMVAYDPNVLENQFLQGWLIQDRYLLRGSFGIVYEFLWANPYQPGLSVYKLDPFFHDPASGAFFVRASWDDDSEWLGVVDGKIQMFDDGQIKTLTRETLKQPVRLGMATIVIGSDGMRFNVDDEEKSRYFLFGMQPGATYDVEVDDRELYEVKADAGGIAMLAFEPGAKAGVRIHKAGTGASAMPQAAASPAPLPARPN